MNVSIFTMASAMCILPCMIIERCFATYFVENYEKKPRKYISISLIFLLITFGTISCYFLRNASNTIYVVICLISLNALALVVTGYLKHYNKVQYNKNHAILSSVITTYSLTQRYQITENIRILRVTLIFERNDNFNISKCFRCSTW